MSISLISILLSIIFLIILGVDLFMATKRKTLKNIYSLGANIIALVLTFIITKVILSKIVGKLSTMLLNKVIVLDEWTKTEAITNFSQFIITIAISIFIFYAVYIILYFIIHLLKRLVFKIINKESYKKYESKNEDNKVINVLISLASFMIITFAFLFPWGAFTSVINYSVKTTNYAIPSELKPILNNPILKVYASMGSEAFFNKITYFKNDDNIKNSQELKGMTTIAFAFLQVEQNPQIAENAKIIKEQLSSTYLIPEFISEVCSNAALRWKNGESFMGESLEIPNDNSKALVIELLNILSKWEKENLINDIDTMYNVYVILEDKDTNLSDSDELLMALTDEEFTANLFLELFHNQDFKSLIPIFINFGIDTMLESLNMQGNGNYVNNIDLDKMTDEDIRKEAHNLSVALNDLIRLKNYASENIKEEDIKELFEGLKEIKDSALLNDKVYSILEELASKMR